MQKGLTGLYKFTPQFVLWRTFPYQNAYFFFHGIVREPNPAYLSVETQEESYTTTRYYCLQDQSTVSQSCSN